MLTALQNHSSTPLFSPVLKPGAEDQSWSRCRTALEHRSAAPLFGTALQHRASSPLRFSTVPFQHRSATTHFNTAIQHRTSAPLFSMVLDRSSAPLSSTALQPDASARC
jgi:hypothetical protein